MKRYFSNKIIFIYLFISYFLLINDINVCGQSPAQQEENQIFNTHFQQTLIEQERGKLDANYTGLKSLQTEEEKHLSLTTTVFAGLRIFNNMRIFYNLEASGGSGLSGVAGIAGFPNGEIARVGESHPNVYTARLFLQSIINIGAKTDSMPDNANSLSAKISPNRIIISAGKFSLLDFFDNINYSHDARTRFLNWSLLTFGAWDYAADTRGYTIGGTADYITPEFSVRLAATMVAEQANGSVYDKKVDKSNALTLEFEKPIAILEQPAKIRALFYRNATNSAYYKDLVRVDSINSNTDIVRHYGTSKFGFGISFEQEINKNIGGFIRASWNDGKTESWMFTEIDRSFCLGAVIKGSIWERMNDEIGLAGVINGISPEHREYLSKGGYGFIIGDGKLNYAPEMITEIYYKLGIMDFINITPDYQYVINPAYNKDRGKISIYSLRLHVEI